MTTTPARVDGEGSCQRLSHLHEVGQALSRGAALDATLLTVLAVLGDALGLERAVAAFDRRGRFETVTWPPAPDDPLRAPAEADAREALLRRLTRGGLDPERLPSRTVVPLVADDRAVGALQLDGPDLGERDLTFVTTVAHQLAQAVARRARPQPGGEPDHARLVEQRERSPVGLVTLSPAGDLLDLNETAARLLGVDGAATGLRLEALLVAEDQGQVAAHVQACLGTGSAPDLEVTPAASRDRRLLLTSRRGEGAAAAPCHAALIDVTARARQEQGLRLLADSASALSSLDPSAVVSRLCRLTVPLLADLCVADLVPDGARLERRVCVVHVDPERGRRFQRAEERWGLLPNAAFATLEALRERRALRIPDVSARYMELAALDGEHLAAIVGLALRSWLLVPLVDPADERPLAVLRLATAGTRRPFDAEDEALAARLAQVGGVALANAQRFARGARGDR